MLIDLIETYDENKKNHLHDLWEKMLIQLSSSFDHKKILTFLAKVGIVDIDEQHKEILI